MTRYPMVFPFEWDGRRVAMLRYGWVGGTPLTSTGNRLRHGWAYHDHTEFEGVVLWVQDHLAFCPRGMHQWGRDRVS